MSYSIDVVFCVLLLFNITKQENSFVCTNAGRFNHSPISKQSFLRSLQKQSELMTKFESSTEKIEPKQNS